MINSDDVAMRFEAIIRKCYGCERYQHKADADIFRTLQSLYVVALQSNKEDLSYEENWNRYKIQANAVLCALKEALSEVNEDSLLPLVENPSNETVGIDAISYILGEIQMKLIH